VKLQEPLGEGREGLSLSLTRLDLDRLIILLDPQVAEQTSLTPSIQVNQGRFPTVELNAMTFVMEVTIGFLWACDPLRNVNQPAAANPFEVLDIGFVFHLVSLSAFFKSGLD